ncbi:plastocyanin/azurin family copper-binding protein [Halostagnicola sp. A-GB9-2]|uniref:cupredoxin domain-containing protein n=1 Tax=Halostagnicola sp. A-GB9-2 TaxID=3048066 RepID=UPI0024C0D002|nr:plastocyanin/azurin family copper-binding protein [Halostagnicola sp. A-GB9-2]MDJ1432644.1 plastocyanin/azurin family copper-binding protein [Halostagnicola sp. A-GB9-2]
MARKRTVSRRTALKVTGAAAATALVAGCSDDDDGNGGDDDDDGGDDGGETIEPGTEIELLGYTGGWEGVAPEEIEGEDNPTLNLEEGEEYDFTWENADGDEHNLEIWDDDGELVDDEYQTDFSSSEGETETLEGVEASDDMAEYVCEPHSSTMNGEINVE